MIELEQTLQDLHIAEQDTVFGRQWHSLTVKEIEAIKAIFILAGFKVPEHLEAMTPERIIYDRMVDLLSKTTTPQDIPGILQLVAVACGIENE